MAQSFHVLGEDLVNGVHDFDNDTFRVTFTNTEPNAATDGVLTDISQIATGNGYTGPPETTVSVSRTARVTTISASSVEIESDGGALPPFQYVVVYNDSAVGSPLVAYDNYPSEVTVQDGESFRVEFPNDLVELTFNN